MPDKQVTVKVEREILVDLDVVATIVRKAMEHAIQDHEYRSPAMADRKQSEYIGDFVDCFLDRYVV